MDELIKEGEKGKEGKYERQEGNSQNPSQTL